MNGVKALLLAAALAPALVACTTVETISVNQIPDKGQRSDKISAHGGSPLIFLIPFGTGYVEDAHDDFLKKCPDGTIEGVLAKTEVTDYFIGLIESQSVTFEGYCVKGGGKSRAKHGKKRGGGA